MKKTIFCRMSLVFLMTLCILLTGCSNSAPTKGDVKTDSDSIVQADEEGEKGTNTPEIKEISPPFDADLLSGADYKSVKADFERNGFLNVYLDEVNDLGSSDENGLISEVSIEGETDFTTDSKYSEDAKVIITYHTVRKEVIPFANDEVKGKDYTEIVDTLKQQGFHNIEIKKVSDEDADNKADGEVEEIAVDFISDFDATAAYPVDTTIIVYYSDKMNKLTIRVDCIGNLLLNKYDVSVYLDEDYIGTVCHGESTEFEAYAYDGNYTLKFEGNTEDVPYGSAKVKISGNKTVKYELYCKSSEVEVELIPSLEIPYTNSDLGKLKSKEIRTSFEKAGYKKVIVVPMNDLSKKQKNKKYLVDKITIDGKKNFSKKSAFYKDSTVKIFYHSAKKISVPYSSDDLEILSAHEAAQKLKDTGFTNVKMKKYDGWYPSDVKNQEIEDIEIDGYSRFVENEEYPWDIKIEIYYYAKEYKEYSAATLINDLEKNAYSASEKYTGEYVIVSGEITAIDPSGRGFAIASSNRWTMQQIDCVGLDEEDKEKLKKLSVGSIVKVRGKIIDVDTFSYTLELDDIL